MNKNQLENLCQQSCVLVEQVAQFIQAELGKVQTDAIETKSLNSLVSYVDKQAEQRLVSGLAELLPGAAFLTEEQTVTQGDGEWRWIIDPLDGTTNFLHQLPFFSISVALQHQGQTVIGIVYEVNRKEGFYAWKEGGAWLNGRRIAVSSNTRMADALIATGFPYYDYSKTQAYFQALEQFMHNSRGIRRLGSAALDLAYVACGRFDAYFEYSLSAWDIAGGAFLVQEAGGKVCDMSGRDQYLDNGEIIAVAGGLSAAFIPIVNKAFYPEPV
ncbi:MAG: inositol monophosphatase family protein [Bacteroidota bacterium]